MSRDEKIDAMYEMMLTDHTLTEQSHAAVFGNGKPGLKTEMERIKGVLFIVVPTLSLAVATLSVFLSRS